MNKAAEQVNRQPARKDTPQEMAAGSSFFPSSGWERAYVFREQHDCFHLIKPVILRYQRNVPGRPQHQIFTSPCSMETLFILPAQILVKLTPLSSLIFSVFHHWKEKSFFSVKDVNFSMGPHPAKDLPLGIRICKIHLCPCNLSY